MDEIDKYYDIEDDIEEELERLGCTDKYGPPHIWMKHEGIYASKFFLDYNESDDVPDENKITRRWLDPRKVLDALRKIPGKHLACKCIVKGVWDLIVEAGRSPRKET